MYALATAPLIRRHHVHIKTRLIVDITLFVKPRARSPPSARPRQLRCITGTLGRFAPLFSLGGGGSTKSNNLQS